MRFRTILCVLSAAAFLSSSSASAQDYVITDLGTLGGSYSVPTAINTAGQIVGYSTTGDEVRHAFVRRDGTMVDLGSLYSGPGEQSEALGINSDGTIVGRSSVSNTGPWHAFLVDADGMTDIASYACAESQSSAARAINDVGLIAGEVVDCDGEMHAAIYDSGTWTELTDVSSRALGINDLGDIVGIRLCGERCLTQAVLWRGGDMIDLGVAGGASRINSAGQVVGTVTSTNEWTAAYEWEYGTVTYLGAPGASRATGLNESGQIVGQSNRHPVLWDDGALIDLDDLWIEGGDQWGFPLSLLAINDLGQIDGSAVINGHTHAFVLTPLSR